MTHDNRKVIEPSDFDYDYFDNPHALGYRGYTSDQADNHRVGSWDDMARFCLARSITSAIDIGCAKGYLIRALQNAGITCIGYDISDYALSFASGLPCVKHDVRFGIPDHADALFCLGVLLYLQNDSMPRVLSDIYNATNHFLLFSSFYRGEPQAVADPLRRITEPLTWWRGTIESAGFKFDSSEEYFDVYRK